MKIVHVSGYYPPHLGGMELRTKDLVESLAQRNHLVEVVTSDIGVNGKKADKVKNLRVQYLKSWELAHTPIMPTLIVKLLAVSKDSVVHLHVSPALVAEITHLVCLIRRLPYVAHIHLDVGPSGQFGFLLPLYKKYFLSTVLRGANVISVLTPDYKELIKEKYKISESKIRVIPNGTHFKMSKKSSLLHKPVRLLFVGRLSVQKNVPLLIKALEICVDHYNISIKLQIVGDGERKDEIKKLVKELKLQEKVTFFGNVDPDKVQKLYDCADIFVLPSVSESFGSVIIEAMASGVPVIATNIPAVRNVVKNRFTGILVEERPPKMAAAIKELVFDSKLRKTLIKNGLLEAKKYTWENVTKQYEGIYQDIL